MPPRLDLMGSKNEILHVRREKLQSKASSVSLGTEEPISVLLYVTKAATTRNLPLKITEEEALSA